MSAIRFGAIEPPRFIDATVAPDMVFANTNQGRVFIPSFPDAAATVAAVGTVAVTGTAEVLATVVAAVGDVGAPTAGTDFTAHPDNAAVRANADIKNVTISTTADWTAALDTVAAISTIDTGVSYISSSICYPSTVAAPGAAVGTVSLISDSILSVATVVAVADSGSTISTAGFDFAVSSVVAAAAIPSVDFVGNRDADLHPAQLVLAADVNGGDFAAPDTGSTMSPDLVAAVADVAAVALALGWDPFPATVVATADVSTVAVGGDGVSNPAVVVAVAAVPAVTVQADWTTAPSAVAAVADVGAVTILSTTDATVSAVEVAAAVTDIAAGARVVLSLQVAAVTAVASVPAPQFVGQTDVDVTPEQVNLQVIAFAVTLVGVGDWFILPNTIAAVTTMPRPRANARAESRAAVEDDNRSLSEVTSRVLSESTA